MNGPDKIRRYYLKSRCGNGIVEKGEECDAHRDFLPQARKWCWENCTYVPPAVCTPFNDRCCDEDGQIAKQETPCLESQLNSCKQKSVCDGQNKFCPPPKPYPKDTLCGQSEDRRRCSENAQCLPERCSDKSQQCECHPCQICCRLFLICEPVHNKQDGEECYVNGSRSKCYKNECLVTTRTTILPETTVNAEINSSTLLPSTEPVENLTNETFFKRLLKLIHSLVSNPKLSSDFLILIYFLIIATIAFEIFMFFRCCFGEKKQKRNCKDKRRQGSNSQLQNRIGQDFEMVELNPGIVQSTSGQISGKTSQDRRKSDYTPVSQKFPDKNDGRFD